MKSGTGKGRTVGARRYPYYNLAPTHRSFMLKNPASCYLLCSIRCNDPMQVTAFNCGIESFGTVRYNTDESWSRNPSVTRGAWPCTIIAWMPHQTSVAMTIGKPKHQGRTRSPNDVGKFNKVGSTEIIYRPFQY